MEKIAIIGISCLLPGAENPEQYWQNLIDQKDLTSKATAVQMGVDAQICYDPIKGKTDKYYCLKGGYIRDFQFDPNGYQISSKLLKSLDNIYQWSLYVSKQALQDSGYFGKTGQCGVILGNLSFPTRLSQHLFAPIYQKMLESAIQSLLKNDDFRLTRLAREVSPLNALISGYPATLIAQSLSLAGPHFSLDGACASSLYAIKVACQYLLSGKADLMLAGAVSGADPFFINMGFSIFQAYPENNMSRPFDKSSDGLVAGEGAGMLVLKRYSDAIREGDKIYATISGIGLSNDGKGKFVLNPNPKGQQIAFERAYTDASINPNSLDYIECHATGTPVGDITELNSMESFFGKHHAVPLIGSVKSNLGHLLTTAGMASLIKVILSMKKGIIPATINLTDPLSSNKGVFSAEKMVKTTMPWPQKTHPKRAAVSAFGFGGTNAHMILEALGDQKSNVLTRGGSITQLALVGMDAFFGGCHGLETFDRTIYDGIQHFIPVPSQRWQGLDAQKELLKNYGFEKGEAPLGAYIQDFEIDFLHFKIPARDEDQLIPQQLLMLKVADNAIRNAGLVEGGNVAVIVAMGTELALHQFRGRCDLSWQIKDSLAQANIVLSPDKTEELEAIAKNSLFPPAQLNQYTSFIGNIMACRIAAQWDFTGPAFTVSAEENAVFSALEVAQQFLATGEVDAVVLGAVDLAGGFESMLLRHQLAPINSGVNTLSYDEKANGWMVGEGAGAVVLKRLDTALAAQDRIYAVIDAISLTSNNAHNALLESLPKTPTAEVVTQSCKQAFEIAGIKATDIGYLEVFGSGIAQEDEAEIKGLTKAYKMVTKNDSLITAIGSVKANIGHTYAASGMASLIKTALCLYHRYIPAVPQWKAPKMPEQWQGSPFYVATESKTWFLEESQSKRVASINGLGLDGTYAHLILSEADSTKRSEAVQYRQQTAFYLFPLAADNHSALHKQLNDLQKNIEQSDDLGATASETFATFQNEPQAHYRLSIVGHDKNELHQQIAFAMQGIKKAFETGEEWKTPLGSYFTAKPLEKVAFVYPAMGTIYIGLGRELFRLYPKLYETSTLGNQINTLLHDKLLYPRSLEKLPIKKQIEAQLYNDGAAMCQIGISFDLLQTAILREYFQIQPQAAFGYSQGELSGMMYALGVWRDNKMLTESLPSSPLYQTQLTGPCFAAHQFWKLPLNLPTKNVWCSYVLKASATAVKDILKHEKCVYLTFISTPEEVTIAGDPKACLRVIKTLKCPHFLIPFNNASHCEIAQPEYEALVQIHLQKVHKVSGITFYSSLDCAPLPLDSDYIAHNSAKLSCQTVDFPGIINRVYKDGVRVFIEIGAGNNCARWIDETLKGKEHVAMSINSKEVDDQTGIVKVLAKLVSHRVSVDLSPLYPMPENCSKPRKSLVKKITLGGKPIYTTILTDENRKSFENQIISHNPMLKIIQLQIAGAMQPLTPPRDDVIWDEADLLEFAEGKIANVFGPEYAIIDSYSRRVQLPLPPYLLVSRVTKLNAKRGLFKASTLTTEYDIPHNMWYSVDGQIPWAVSVESGQCDLLLISYLGIDFENKGILVYRLLDCTMTFLEDIPTEGDTLRYDISINSFVRHGNNLLFFFSYDCFVGDKMVLTMDGGCAGFFTDDELDKGKGVVYSKKELTERDQIQKQQFEPLLICQKSSFYQKDMIHLTDGNIAACFGEHYWQAGLNPSLRVPPKEILMIDQVTSVDFNGGAYGFGLIIGAKILEPEHWYFPCHFKDDQVMAGSLMAEGCGQLLQFYLLYLGFQTCTTDARFQPIPNLRQVVRCRGQVTPISATLIYRLEITELGLSPKPYAKGDVEIILNGKIVVHFKDVGVQLSEKNQSLPVGDSKEPLASLVKLPRQSALLNEEQIQEFCLGSVAKCFGPEFEIYDTGGVTASRMPNTHLNFVHRVLEVQGERHKFTPKSTIITEYDAPIETWYYRHNSSDTIPYSVLMEIALQPCGFLSAYLGTTLLYPDNSLYFRNLDGRGRILKKVDIRGKTVTNRSRLLSQSNIQGMIIQSFDFEMLCDGEPFYQGDATFGFFSSNALANQIGLDGGKAVLPWIETENRPGLPIISIDLKNQASRTPFYQINAQKPGYRLAQHQLDLLDEVKIVKGGGRYQQGYIYARKQIKPTDWYFKCHFHQDPVMPGSLGVEAILQAMQVYALQLDLGQHLKSPRFGQLIDHEVIWKYRGQIPQPDDQTEMYLEVHLSKVEIGNDKVTLMGDASLWKPNLRIYEVKNVAVCLLESTV
ncbi:MAG: 3-hydroxyacyl-[acyl-carrier-protein] dehydratase FabA [Candidatus Parabeggiatoa sp. nov. 3]|nr:MAG: 3-hydroxyacyl-[acyl-carrier-protein] dehydratase FabA [Gammaproteobacteria bacterium]